jgi:hypothetical protein
MDISNSLINCTNSCTTSTGTAAAMDAIWLADALLDYRMLLPDQTSVVCQMLE